MKICNYAATVSAAIITGLLGFIILVSLKECHNHELSTKATYHEEMENGANPNNFSKN